jgi:hypothetical protein
MAKYNSAELTHHRPTRRSVAPAKRHIIVPVVLRLRIHLWPGTWLASKQRQFSLRSWGMVCGINNRSKTFLFRGCKGRILTNKQTNSLLQKKGCHCYGNYEPVAWDAKPKTSRNYRGLETVEGCPRNDKVYTSLKWFVSDSNHAKWPSSLRDSYVET